jgi:hypothetical protein
MKSNAWLNFIAVILVALCVVIAIRALTRNRHTNSGSQFMLIIKYRARLINNPNLKNAQELVQGSIDCSMDFKPDEKSTPEPVCGDESKAKKSPGKPKGSRGGPAHLQQRVEFRDAKSLKKLVNALESPGEAEQPVPSSPENSSSPAPHLQQTAGMETPESEKAIAAALRR